MQWRTRPLTVLAAALLVGGCSSDDSDASEGVSSATPSSAASPSTGSPGPGTGATPSSGSPGCPPAAAGQPSAVPDGASSEPTLDVDGDGRADTVYIDDETDVGGGVPFGIQTASGANFAENFISASPQSRSVLVADVTGQGELVALASDGRQVLLFAISNCSIVPVTNPQGDQYTFDLGFTGYGTGVGCGDVTGDGTPELVGLLLQTDGAGNPTAVQRTVVELDGPRASNGTTDTVPPTASAVDSARSITCGDLTLDADGVNLPS